jgi:hypothetical protein
MTTLKRLRECSAGAIAAITAIVLPVLLGFGSLGVEVGHWYLVQREMQGAADATAFSAAAEYIYQYNKGNLGSTSYQTVGQTYASLNGFAIPSSDVCLATKNGDCNTTQLTCATDSGKQCVVVDISQLQTQWFLPHAEPTLHAYSLVSIKATNSLIQSAGNGCLLALETTGVGLNLGGNGQLGPPAGETSDCTIASNSTPTSITAPTGGKSGVVAAAAILAQSTAFTCPKGNCTIPKITYSTITPDPDSTRTFGTAPRVPILSVTSLTRSGTTATATVASTASLSTGQQVTISGATNTQYNGTFTITVKSSTQFTYAVTGSPKSPDPSQSIAVTTCVAFQNNANNPGGTDSQHMKCYLGGTTSGTTTFNRFTIFSGAMTLGGTTTFNGAPTAPAVYAFDGGLTLGGNNTLGAGIYYVLGSGGLTSGNGSVSCAITANTTTAACPLNNNAYGGITFVLTSSPTNGGVGQFGGSQGTAYWTALCTDSPPSGATLPIPGCDTQSSQIYDAAGKAIDTSGLVIFASRSATGTGATLQGQIDLTIDGTLYFPGETFSLHGQATFETRYNANNQPTICTAIIAQTFDWQGQGTINNGCLTGIGGNTSTQTTLGSPLLSQ